MRLKDNTKSGPFYVEISFHLESKIWNHFSTVVDYVLWSEVMETMDMTRLYQVRSQVKDQVEETLHDGLKSWSWLEDTNANNKQVP